MSWDLSSDRPIYTQLIEQIELRICSGFTLRVLNAVGPGSGTGGICESQYYAKGSGRAEETGLCTLAAPAALCYRGPGQDQRGKGQAGQDHVKAFLKKMKELGFDHEEILEILRDFSGGDKK